MCFAYICTCSLLTSERHMINFENSAIAFSSKTDKELKKAKWLFTMINYPSLVNIGATLARWSMKLSLPIGPIVKSTIFPQFCGGETLKESQAVIKRLSEFNILSLLDYAIEGKTTEAEFEDTKNELLRIVNYAGADAKVPIVTLKVTGLGRFELLEKVNAKAELTEEEQAAWHRIMNRLDEICKAGQASGTGIYIDAEESWIQDAIDDLAEEMMVRYNTEKAVVFNTAQLYRHDRLEFLKQSYEKAKAGGYYLGMKVVRGAYMEKERNRAEEMGYPSPIQPDKASTDRDFDAAARFCLDHYTEINFCIASHNEKSCKSLAELVEEKGMDKSHPHINFSQLFGMSDHISFNLAKNGFNVAKYMPYGPVKEVLPYLIRRARENTAIAGQMSRELSLIRKELARRKKG